MRQTRIQIAKPDIVNLFNENPKKVFKRSDLSNVFYTNARFWRLSTRMTLSDFIDFLLEKTSLREVKLPFPSRTDTKLRSSLYQLATEIR